MAIFSISGYLNIAIPANDLEETPEGQADSTTARSAVLGDAMFMSLLHAWWHHKQRAACQQLALSLIVGGFIFLEPDFTLGAEAVNEDWSGVINGWRVIGMPLQRIVIVSIAVDEACLELAAELLLGGSTDLGNLYIPYGVRDVSAIIRRNAIGVRLPAVVEEHLAARCLSTLLPGEGIPEVLKQLLGVLYDIFKIRRGHW